jgi:uncharacterized Tic20 family protein
MAMQLFGHIPCSHGMTTDTTCSPGSLPPATPAQVTVQSSNDRLWSVLCHLSYFFGFALISFLFPMTVFLVTKGDSPYVVHHAREALNFHLSLLVYFICCIPLCFIVIGFPLLGVVAITGIVCSIVAAVKASKGEYYEYPVTIRFVR